MIKSKNKSVIRRDEEPRFRADPEPTTKNTYRTMRTVSHIWNGNEWELLSVRFGDVTSDEIPMQIAKWLKSDEYKKLVKKK